MLHTLIPVLAAIIFVIAIINIIRALVTGKGLPTGGNNANMDHLHSMMHEDAMRAHTQAHNMGVHLHDIAHTTAVNNFNHHMHMM